MKASIFTIVCCLLLGYTHAQQSCSSPHALTSADLPYSSPNSVGNYLTTCGMGDFYDGDPNITPGACNNSNEDTTEYVYSFTATSRVCLSFQLTYFSTAVSLFVYDGCPDSPSFYCVDKDTGGNPRELNNITVPAGSTYYFMISDNTSCGEFQFNVFETPSIPGVNCCNPFPMSAADLPLDTIVSTVNMQDAYDQSTLGVAVWRATVPNSPSSSAMSYTQDHELVIEYTTTGPECLTIAIDSLDASSPDPGIYVMDGCPDVVGTNVLAYAYDAWEPSSVDLNVTLPQAGVYYIIVGTKGSPNWATFHLDINSNTIPLVGPTCQSPVFVATLPFVASGLTTCCMGDDYGSTDACNSSYLNGLDVVLEYVASSAESITIVLPDSMVPPGVDVGVFVMDGCPDAVGTQCVAYATETNQPGQVEGVSITAQLATGTYYIVAVTEPGHCATFDLGISSNAPGLPGDVCSYPVDVTLPYTVAADSTNGYADSYNNASVASCGSAYEAGNDKVYRYVKTTTTSECLNIRLTETGVNRVTAHVYDGCPDNASTNCLGTVGPASGTNNRLGSAVLPGAGSYYVVVDCPTPTATSYKLELSSTDNSCVKAANLRAQNIQDVSAIMRWDTVCGATSYKILYKLAGSASWQNIVFANGQVGWKQLQGLVPDTTYKWVVRTRCGNTWSFATPMQTFHTLPSPCNSPTGLFANYVNSNRARLNWGAVSGAITYRIGLRVAGTSAWTNYPVSGTRTNVWFVGLSSATNYEWRMKTVCQFGNSSGGLWSGIQQFTTATAKHASYGSPQLQLSESGLVLFPNPTNGQVNVRHVLDLQSAGRLTIYNAVGERVHQQLMQPGSASTSIELGHLRSGLYIVQLEGDGLHFQEKLLVQ